MITSVKTFFNKLNKYKNKITNIKIFYYHNYDSKKISYVNYMLFFVILVYIKAKNKVRQTRMTRRILEDEHPLLLIPNNSK